MELSSPKTKKFLIFAREKSFLIFLDLKLFKTTSYISGGNYPSLKTKKGQIWKKSLIFLEIERSSPKLKKLLYFSLKKLCYISAETWKARRKQIAYISPKKKFPTFLDNCWLSRKIKEIPYILGWLLMKP